MDDPTLEQQLLSELVRIHSVIEDENGKRDLRIATNRKSVRWARGVGAFALLVAVTAVGFSFHQGNAQCQAGNTFRRADRERWEYIVGLTDSDGLTKSERDQRGEFLTFIRRADKLRDCSLL